MLKVKHGSFGNPQPKIRGGGGCFKGTSVRIFSYGFEISLEELKREDGGA